MVNKIALVVGIIFLLFGGYIVTGIIIINSQENSKQTNTLIEWYEQAKLLASDGTEEDKFGISVSIDGDYAIVGAYEDNDFMGSAYIFKRNGSTWIEQAKLQASDGVAGDRFGYSVSIDGEYIIIGADGNDDDKGAAYIFKRNDSTWIQHAKLTASDGAIENRFGFSVSIDGDYVGIGAQHDDDDGWRSGSAYIFKRYDDVWIQEQKLTASDGETFDLFGISVSIDEDYVVIGASGANNNLGAAYIFKRNGSLWVEEAKLIASDCVSCRYVSIDGEYVILGDYHSIDFCGAAYIFKRNDSTWIQHAKLTASDGAIFDWFGKSVCINGNHVIVGAVDDDDNGDGSGSAYIFKRNGSIWEEESKIMASDGAKLDFFGNGVSIDGDYAIIGAHFDDDNGDESGSVYIFKRNQIPDVPTIRGPTIGKPGIRYTFCITPSDPDGDSLYILWDWGDGTSSGWLGPFESGVEICDSHIWNERGDYTITVTLRDDYGGTITATLKISIPRNRATFGSSWFRFFDMFPILQRILNLIKGLQ